MGRRFLSPSKDYLVGGMLELRVNPNWSFEVNGLFRQLSLNRVDVSPDGSINTISPAPVVTWEFPLLAKYRLQTRQLRPFFEAGPSFRTAGNLNGTNPSHRGITAGVGVEMHWRTFAIAPAVRYTRWAIDNNFPNSGTTAPNQVEFVVGFSRAATSVWRPSGKRVSLGVILGTSLSADFRRTEQPGIDLFGRPLTYFGSSGPRSLVVGPMVEVHLPRGFSVEVNALHRTLSTRLAATYSDGTPVPPRASSGTLGVGRLQTWEFPVLAKYTFAFHEWKPFVGLGPSFRFTSRINESSPFGIAATTGIHLPLWKVRISPAIRFTRWQADRLPRPQNPVRNQLLVVVGFSL